MFRVNRVAISPVIAEFLGTGFLVLIAVILGQTTGVSYFIATSLAATAAVIYLLFSSISGAHANPAITLGLWTTRRLGHLRAISYIAAQLLGGLVAWQLFQYLTNHTLQPKTVPFSGRLFVGEIVGTSILAMAFMAAVSRSLDTLYSAIAIGAAYFVGILAAATSSAGFINPAVALGSRAWSGVYVLGPLVGGVIGANLYRFLVPSGIATSSTGVTVRRKSTTKVRS